MRSGNAINEIMNYENGLKILEAFVKAEDEQTLNEFDLAKAQLISQELEMKLFGPNDGVRANINRVIYKLNPLARRLTEMSFVDLSVDTYKLEELFYTLLRQTPRNKVHVVASIIVHNQLSPNKVFLDNLATRYQVPLITNFGDEGTEIGPAIEWRGPDDAELQSFLRPEPKMVDVGFLKRAVESTSSVCKIEIPQLNRTCTGFLIAPTLVLTNYHVLGLNDAEVENNAAHVVLRFGYITEDSRQTFNLDTKQPILSQSPVENGLDYVLLQVDNNITINNDIKPAPYDFSQPTQGKGVHILQHPQGDTMKLAINDNGITGIYQSEGLIQYVTRTQGGSSGAPCFNEDWNVVALHHAERAKSFGKIREGILFTAIYDKIKDYLK